MRDNSRRRTQSYRPALLRRARERLHPWPANRRSWTAFCTGACLRRRRVAIRGSQWDALVLPLLRERVFHATPRAAYDRIIVDGAIRANADGSLGDGFVS